MISCGCVRCPQGSFSEYYIFFPPTRDLLLCMSPQKSIFPDSSLFMLFLIGIIPKNRESSLLIRVSPQFKKNLQFFCSWVTRSGEVPQSCDIQMTHIKSCRLNILDAFFVISLSAQSKTGRNLLAKILAEILARWAQFLTNTFRNKYKPFLNKQKASLTPPEQPTHLNSPTYTHD